MNNILWPQLKEKDPLLCELFWKEYYSHQVPASNVYKDKMLLETTPTSFVHITPNMNEIINEGKAWGSTGGCLGPGLYVSPLLKNGKLSPLSSHTLLKRVNWNDKNLLDVLIFEVSPTKSHHKIVGVDYLTQGDLQYELASTFNTTLFKNASKEAKNKLDSCLSEIQLLANYDFAGVSTKEFQHILNNLYNTSSFFSNIAYEVLQEFVCLFHARPILNGDNLPGELNYWAIKELAFEINPSMRAKFNFHNFKPRLKEISLIFKRNANRKNYFSADGNIFSEFFKYRYAQTFRYKICQFTQSTNDLSSLNTKKSLVGHLIHRQIKQNYQGEPIMKEYELYRQQYMLNELNNRKIAYSYNKILPINEYCLNPNIKNYQTYIGHVDPNSGRIFGKKKIDIVLANHNESKSIISNFRPI